MRTDMENMNNRMHGTQLPEQISALIDGECSADELDLVLSALKIDEHKRTWEIYQLTGDVINSTDLAINFSDGFTARLNAQLASEPVYINQKQKIAKQYNHHIAYAIAAMLALIAIFVPQFAGHDGAETSAPYYTGQLVASGSSTQPRQSVIALTSSQKIRQPSASNSRSTTAPQMLRDPLIDSYLAAHQSYSNSMYSAVEYESSPIVQEAGK